MNGLILVLSLICGAASLAAMVCAALILRQLRRLDAPSPVKELEKAAEEPEEPTDLQKSMEQGIDNLMTYSLETMKASRKGLEGDSWR